MSREADGRRAEAALDEGRLRDAARMYEELIRVHAEDSLLWCYQLGVLNQAMLGDGEAARRWYALVFDMDPAGMSVEALAAREEISAFAAENMMLLALSFDEFESSAERLELLRPAEPILLQQRPRIRDMREAGHQWRTVMAGMAQIYHDPTVEHSGGDGFAASIYQLMLLHRKLLRLPRDEWRTAAIRYGAHMLLLGASHLRAMETRAMGATDITFLLGPAVGLVKEYVDASRADEEAQRILQTLERSIRQADSPTRPAASQGGRRRSRWPFGSHRARGNDM